jgi:uncharacterized protein (TIGR02231 family)
MIYPYPDHPAFTQKRKLLSQALHQITIAYVEIETNRFRRHLYVGGVLPHRRDRYRCRLLANRASLHSGSHAFNLLRGSNMKPLKTIVSIVLLTALFVSTIQSSSLATASMTEVSAIDTISTAGRIEAVTVYRGQALVTRALEFEAERGLVEVVVSDLPDHVVPDSFHAKALADAFIRSVRYRERPVRIDVRSEVQKLEEELAARRDDLTRLEHQAETNARLGAYLDKLERFTADGAGMDLGRGVLDAEALTQLSRFIFAEREKQAERSLDLQMQQRDIKREISHLQQELSAIGARATRTAREAIIIVEVQQPGDVRIDLNYLVNRATWTPSYTVRAALGESQLVVEYFASIEQTSGEDWKDVRMTLSTATPSLVAGAPMLAALPVQLRPAGTAPPTPASRETFAVQRRLLEEQRAQSLPYAASRGAPHHVELIDQELNVLADTIQVMELLGRHSGQKHDLANGAKEGHSVSYQIAGRTGLPSRTGHQLIQIASTPLAGEFYQVAIPVLTSYVYREARMENRTDRVLLAGPVSTYVDGQFVGHGSFSDIAIGETMTVGFGVNSMLRSQRALIDQQERVQGGNAVVDLTYRLTLENFSDEASIVRLKDRLPLVKPNEIKLTIVDSGTDNGNGIIDHHYDAAQGIMTWHVNVPAGATGRDAATVEYTIRLEYDRQMAIVSMNR